MAEGAGVSEMDQETAQFLLREGATLIFLDVPPGTEFGIDYNSWYVGPKFKGVKMIPPGIHFVHYSAVNQGQAAPRTGFFHDFTQQQVLLKRWDPATESVSTEVVCMDDRESVENNKRDMDRFLGAYPYESYRKWVSLTNHLTPGLLSNLHPLCGTISSVTALVSKGSNTSERKEAAASAAAAENLPNKDNLPDMAIVPGTEIRFTKIPEKKYPESATPVEITRYNMDHSYVLKSLMDKVYSKVPKHTPQISEISGDGDETSTHHPILGEIQFAFICFLIGQNYDGFEQWKQLVHLLCSCEEAIKTYPSLFSHFITVLHRQIGEVPEDFFVDIVTADNFLTRTLQQFFSTLNELDYPSGEVVALCQRGLRFRRHLEKKFQWDFLEEPDEYAPVVVT